MQFRFQKEYGLLISVLLLFGIGVSIYAGGFSVRFADFLYKSFGGDIVLERHRIQRRATLEDEISAYTKEYFLGSYRYGVIDPGISYNEIQKIIVFDTIVLIDLSTAILEKNISTESFQEIRGLLIRGLWRTFRMSCDVRFLFEGNEFTNMAMES